MIPGALLIVEDDPGLLELLRTALAKEGHEVVCATSAGEARERLSERPVDLILTDLWLKPTSGLELLREVRARFPDTLVTIMTGRAEIDSAVACIKEGAYDYVTKPFDLRKLILDVAKALEHKRLQEDFESLQQRLDGRWRLGHLIGRSPRMQEIFDAIERVAPIQSTVLVLGESGTGKEVVAREIHCRSPRASGPFIPVNCGSLPATLLEAELFGHEKGTFTGADRDKAGLFEAASGGTIFLDEIGVTTPQTQIGLLRILQEREVRRVGGTRSRKVDVRVVAATNANLERGMEEGSFRRDLYYRLSALTLTLPPLRERPEDVPLLAEHLLRDICHRLGKPPRKLSPRVLEVLSAYPWPGNVRELANVLEQAVIFSARPLLRPRDLALPQAPAHSAADTETLEALERRHIERVLHLTAGNKMRAARILGIPRASLYRRMRRLGLDATHSH
ncbi:MAG: sigma-54 dependent transcriptional regulator [Acidobacteriota bacterium]